MSDLIDRQAAIDGLDKLRPRMIDTYERDGDCFLKVRACDVNDMLQSLPSAQPDRSLWFRIGEVCVNESKGDITAEVAIEKIRALLRVERREQ